MDEFLDSHPLPANIKEVDCQSNGKNLHFLRSIDPTNIKRRSLTHWITLTVFGRSVEWSRISIEWSLTFLRAVFGEKD